jgi:hypothetical protein
MPVIAATHEEEVGAPRFKASLYKKLVRLPRSSNKLSLMIHDCNSSYADVGGVILLAQHIHLTKEWQ